MVPPKEAYYPESFLNHLKSKFGEEETASPNFGYMCSFKNVKLPRDPLYWPYLEVLVTDKHRKDKVFHFGKGCEDCYTTISLLDFADKFFASDERVLIYCRE